jgi:hypothetical protein
VLEIQLAIALVFWLGHTISVPSRASRLFRVSVSIDCLAWEWDRGDDGGRLGRHPLGSGLSSSRPAPSPHRSRGSITAHDRVPAARCSHPCGAAGTRDERASPTRPLLERARGTSVPPSYRIPLPPCNKAERPPRLGRAMPLAGPSQSFRNVPAPGRVRQRKPVRSTWL